MKNLRDLFRRTGWASSTKRRQSKTLPVPRGRRLQSETLEKRNLLAADIGLASDYALAHNYWHPADVDDNKEITAGDALRVINLMNRHGGTIEITEAGQIDSFADVNADGMVSASDALFVINSLNRGEAAGELVELFANARDANDAALTDATNREITVNVGELFYIELSYSDLRGFGDDLGAFQVSADFDLSIPNVVTPVLSETQQFTIEGIVRSANSGSVVLSLEGSTATSEVTLAAFTSGPVPAIRAAVEELGFEADDFSVRQLAANLVTFPGQGDNPDPSNFTYEVRFDPNQFRNVDVPNITIASNFDIPVRVLSTATPPVDGEGNINGDAAGDNVDVRSRTDPSSTDPFGELVYGLRKFGAFDPAVGFDEIGTLGPANPGGLKSEVGDPFPEPFDTFSIPVFINQPVTGLTITLNQGENDEAILLYGRNEKVPSNLVIVNEQQTQIIVNAIGSAVGVTAADTTVPAFNEDPVDPITVDLADLTTINSGGAVTYEVVSNGSIGNATITGSVLTYTPAADANGSDSIVYRATNDAGNDTGTISLSIDPVNDPPTAGDDTATTDEVVPVVIDVLANDTGGPTTPDANESQVLTISNITTPANGTATPSGTGIQYTPATGFSGTDTFSYTVTDDGGLTATATVTVTVNAVNVGPSAADDELSILEDALTPVSVDLNSLVTIQTGGAASLAITTGGSLGTATLEGTVLSYVPDADAFGTDTIVYTATNSAGSDSGTITVTIAPVNDPPVANDDTASGNEDTVITVDVLVNDTAGPGEDDLLTIQSVADGANGTTLVNSNGQIEYTPDPDFFGSDTFTYVLSDGSLTDTATVTVTVNPINDPPEAIDDSATTDEDNAVTIDVLANDSDGAGNEGDTLTVQLDPSDPPSSGTAVVNSNNTITYTPDANFFGQDSFGYLLSDGVETVPATVTVTVNPVNDPPVANDDAVTTLEDTAIAINVLSNDNAGPGESDPLSVSVTTPPSNGTTSVDSAGVITYTPADSFFGTDSFQYTLSDGSLTDTATVTITVTDVLAPPVAENTSLNAVEDAGTVTVDLAGLVTVDEGDTFSLSISGSPSRGTASIAGTVLSYTPSPDEFGSDTITYTATNSVGSDSGTISIAIEAVNDPPVVTVETVTANQNASLTFNALAGVSPGADNETDVLTLVSVGTPTAGTAVQDGNSITYTPPTDFTGPVSLEYVISDGITEVTSTITIDVRAFSPSTISGAIFFDLVDNIVEYSQDPINVTPVRNGVKDSDEVGLGGATLRMTSAADDNATGSEVDVTTLTNLDGVFTFDDVAPGTYQIQYDAPASVIVGSVSPGSGGLMQIIIGAEGDETVSGLSVGLIGMRDSGLGYLSMLASRHISENGPIDQLSGGGIEGGVVAFNGDGSQQFFKPNEGFDDVSFAELVLNENRDAALLTIINSSGEIQTARLSDDFFVVNRSGTAAQFFGSVADFDFAPPNTDLLRAEFAQYRNAIDRVLAEMGSET